MKAECALSDIHWISDAAPSAEFRCEVRPRYRSNGAIATVKITGKGEGSVVFDEPQFALTPGQAAVFYHEAEVLGGGWIDMLP